MTKTDYSKLVLRSDHSIDLSANLLERFKQSIEVDANLIARSRELVYTSRDLNCRVKQVREIQGTMAVRTLEKSLAANFSE
jgi:hypothetical protein